MIVASPRVTNIALPQFDLLNSRAAELRAQGHHVISMGQAVPGFSPPAAALVACQAAIADGRANVYSSDAGLRELREILCRRLTDTLAVTATPDEVIVTAGGNQAFMLAAMTLIDPGDEVVLASPYFANHEMAIRAVGGLAIEAPLSEEHRFGVRWKDIERHLTSRTRGVVICTPSNPTGAVTTRVDLEQIQKELASREIVLFVDETYMHFVYTPDGHQSAAGLDGWRDNVVVVGTFSKSFAMTGWRVGYLLADRRICEQAIKIQDAMIICAPVISQIAVEAAVREDWTYPLAFHGELLLRRQALIEELAAIPRLRWTVTGGGFFAFVHVDGCTDSAALATDLLERAHVVTIPGATFGRTGEGFLRVSYGSAGVGEVREGVRRIGRYFQ